MKRIFLQNLSQLKFLLAFENDNHFYFEINWCARVWIKGTCKLRNGKKKKKKKRKETERKKKRKENKEKSNEKKRKKTKRKKTKTK